MTPAPVVRVRWRVFGLIFGLSMLAYLQQKTLTVTADRMMHELALSQMQIGWLESAFVTAYAGMQLLGGVIGQRVGAQRALLLFGLVAVTAMLAMPVAAAFMTGIGLFFALFTAQFVLGFSQGPLFPITAGVMEAWFPPRQWPVTMGLQSTGLQLGAMMTPFLITRLMLSSDWQHAILWTSVPAFVLVFSWFWYVRNTPEQHASVTPAELAELGADRGPTVDPKLSFARVLALLSDRNILLLTFSYFCMNYLFYLLANWVFLYLRQVRHFPELETGNLSMLPPLAAAVGAGVGGFLASYASRRLGLRWGFRIVPLIAMPLAGALLLLVAKMPTAFLAAVVLALAYGTIELTEASFWSATMNVARADTMAACGALNTGGNLAGVVGIPIVAYLSGHAAWNTSFALGGAFAVVSALCWLAIDAERPFQPRAGEEHAQ
jgi:MFS transporter, ACS family, glucarate transporter